MLRQGARGESFEVSVIASATQMVFFEPEQERERESMAAVVREVQAARPELQDASVDVMFVRTLRDTDRLAPMSHAELNESLSGLGVSPLAELPGPIPVYRSPTPEEDMPDQHLGLGPAVRFDTRPFYSPSILIIDAQGIIRWD